jgi:hypothetical protein
MLSILGDRGLIQSADAFVAAFTTQFSYPTFFAHARTTGAIGLAADNRPTECRVSGAVPRYALVTLPTS